MLLRIAFRFSTSLISWLTTVCISFIGGFFISFHNAIMLSRQIETNTRLARLMRHEYPGLSDAQILNELNYKTLRRAYDE